MYQRRMSFSTNMWSVCACQYALLHHVHSQILYLVSLSVQGFFEVFFSLFLFYDEEICSQNNLTEHILFIEYGNVVINCLSKSPLSSKEMKLCAWLETRQNLTALATYKTQQITLTWPSVVPNNVVFDCLKKYCNQTVWIPPLVCCVCGLQQKKIVEIVLMQGCESSIDFSLLLYRDPFITTLADEAQMSVHQCLGLWYYHFFLFSHR